MEEDDNLPPRPKVCRLDKDRSVELRGWMTSLLKTTEAKQLREEFSTSFDKHSFYLKVPKLDHSMPRRLKELKAADAAKTVASRR